MCSGEALCAYAICGKITISSSVCLLISYTSNRILIRNTKMGKGKCPSKF